MIELKDIGERLVSIVSVEHYALGLLKMLETHSQKEVANYIGVSPSKLSPIVQLLTEIHINKPCIIVRYIRTDTNRYYLLKGTNKLNIDENYIDIFKFDDITFAQLIDEIAIQPDISIEDNYSYIQVDKLPQITIDALHNLEYKHKA